MKQPSVRGKKKKKNVKCLAVRERVSTFVPKIKATTTDYADRADFSYR